MKLYSPNFQNNQTIPVVFTADGSNKCPDFIIQEVPDNAKSLVILCHDPDATSGVPWIHWLAWGLPSVDKIIAGELPEGSVDGLNSFGNYGYGGPSPSPGTGPHRYVFTIYATHDGVDLRDATTYKKILNSLKDYIIDQASLTGIYLRP